MTYFARTKKNVASYANNMSSFGFADKHVAKSVPVSTASTAVPEVQSKSKTHLNYNSRCSVWTVYSISSFLALASAFSIGSFGSVLSVGSVLSFGSSASVLSLFSQGCFMMMYTDCTQGQPSPQSHFEITIEEDIYRNMSKCTKAMYEQYQADDANKEECDYKDAKCKYTPHTGVSTGYLDCKVRRKGSSTWRDMDAKPSFKIKKLETDVQFAVGWFTDKVTFNNMMYPGVFYQTYSEVAAYATYRALKKRATPMAVYTSVAIVVGDIIRSEDLYAMVETINDNNFLNKHFEKDTSLYETELLADEFKRSTNHTIDNRKGGDLENHQIAHNARLATLDMDDAILYYVGEIVTGHWDGICIGKGHANNAYTAFEYKSSKYTLIPSGLDNTFQGCLSTLLSRDMYDPGCTFMKECFQNTTCTDRFHELLAHARAMNNVRKVESCSREIVPYIVICVISFLGPIIVFMIYSSYTNYSKTPKVEGGGA